MLLDALNAQALAQAIEGQTKVGELVQAVLSTKGVAGAEWKSRLNKELAILQPEAFASALANLKDAKNSPQGELLESLRTALAGLDTLADERIRPKEVLAKEVLERRKRSGRLT